MNQYFKSRLEIPEYEMRLNEERKSESTINIKRSEYKRGNIVATSSSDSPVAEHKNLERAGKESRLLECAETLGGKYFITSSDHGKCNRNRRTPSHLQIKRRFMSRTPPAGRRPRARTRLLREAMEK